MHRAEETNNVQTRSCVVRWRNHPSNFSSVRERAREKPPHHERRGDAAAADRPHRVSRSLSSAAADMKAAAKAKTEAREGREAGIYRMQTFHGHEKPYRRRRRGEASCRKQPFLPPPPCPILPSFLHLAKYSWLALHTLPLPPAPMFDPAVAGIERINSRFPDIPRSSGPFQGHISSALIRPFLNL